MIIKSYMKWATKRLEFTQATCRLPKTDVTYKKTKVNIEHNERPMVEALI